jgi:phage terminase large subunit-like protein
MTVPGSFLLSAVTVQRASSSRAIQSARRVHERRDRRAVFSSEEPESLRGYQFELVVIDELAKMRYAQQVFDQAMLTLRLGDKPRTIIATTPRPTRRSC